MPSKPCPIQLAWCALVKQLTDSVDRPLFRSTPTPSPAVHLSVTELPNKFTNKHLRTASCKLNIGIEFLRNICLSACNESEMPKPCPQYTKNELDEVYLHFFDPMPPHVLVDFVVLPLGHGSSVTDFWGWDAHEAQLRCPDGVSGDIGGWSARRVS